MAQHITLTKEERTELSQLIKSGKHSARVLGRARILLLLDRSQGQQRTLQEIADAMLTSIGTVYQQPYDPKRPQICLDKIHKNLRSTPRGDIPMEKGKPKREDHEYECNGKCALFLAVEHLAGFRQVWVRPQRTMLGFAEILKQLVDEVYPDADKLVLVTDNLNIHHTACLYKCYSSAEARRIAMKIEWHYTPVHASWLNIAECELSVFKRQCLRSRTPDIATVVKKVTAWIHHRNSKHAGIDWRFTTEDARIKLKRLYPVANVQESS